MNLKTLRNDQGQLSGIIIPTEDIAELKDSLKTDSVLFDNINKLLVDEGKTTDSIQKMPNGLTVEETNEKAFQTTRQLYKDAFSKGVAMYYQDDRVTSPREFVRANPDGSEDLVSFDLFDRSYSLIRKLVPAGAGRWANLL